METWNFRDGWLYKKGLYGEEETDEGDDVTEQQQIDGNLIS